MAATISVCVLGEKGELKTGGPELLDRPGTKWIDVLHPDEASLKDLGARYGLHRLAIEDCLHLDQRPKLEEYPNHAFVVLQSFCGGEDNVAKAELHEVHFFISNDWLISVHREEDPSVESARHRVLADPNGTLGRGPDFVMYLIADGLADHVFPILDRLNEELEDLEDQIFEAPKPAQLRKLFELKRTLVTFRRVLSPQRDVVGLLSRRGGLPYVKERTVLYFRDVNDHLVRLYEQIDSERDLLSGALDGYLSMVANRTNEVSKQLTIIATIFLPLTFVTGFFGQNFPVLSHPVFLYLMLAVTAATPVVMMWWFRGRRWL